MVRPAEKRGASECIIFRSASVAKHDLCGLKLHPTKKKTVGARHSMFSQNKSGVFGLKVGCDVLVFKAETEFEKDAVP